jgi:PKD repeat protein
MKKLLVTALLIYPFILFAQNINFTASKTSLCPPDTVSFTNTSTIGDSFVWYFSNTNSHDTGQSISHLFQNTGEFTVVLSAYDSNGSFIGYKSETITSVGADTIIYSVTDTFCPNDPIHFSIKCYDVDSVIWNMRNEKTYTDLSVSSQPNFVYSVFNYSYSKKGTYEVKAIVFSSCGIDTIRKNVVINNSKELTGYFNTVIPDGDYCPLFNGYFYAEFYNFNDDVRQIIFDYGDGDSSVVNIDQNSNNRFSRYHIYTDTGTYFPRIIFRNNCFNEKVYSDTLRIVNNLREFQSDTIIIQKNSTCDPYAVNFMSSANTTVWDFGDGHFSTSPKHRYIYPGKYIVKAHITNGCGYDTILSREISIIDTFSIDGNVQISWHKKSICPGTEIKFRYNGNVNCYQNHYWVLNDSLTNEEGIFTFNKKGINIIKLVFENYGRKDYIVTDTVIVVDSIPFQNLNTYPSYINCQKDVMFSYYNQGQYNITDSKWYFSTGDSSKEKNPYIHLNSSGKYSLILHLTNSCGFDTVFYDTFKVVDFFTTSIFINQTISKKNICPGEETIIYASYYGSNIAIDSIILSIGDSVIENYEVSENIKKSFSKPGKYPVSFRLVNTCGKDTVISDTITVSNSLPVSTKDYSIYTPDKTCLLDTLSVRVYTNNLSYKIEIDDTLREPGFQHFYSTGIYNIKYHFENSCGQKLVVEDSIEIVNTLPIEDNIFFISEPQNHLTNNEIISFYCPFSFNDNYFSVYEWNFGDGDSLLYNRDFVTHFYETPGDYLVKLRVENYCGFSKSYSKLVTVDSCRNVFNSTAIDIEDGDDSYYINKNLVNYSFSFRTNTPSEYYTIEWDFGDGNTSNFPKPKHSYSKDGVYHVKLKLKNKCGFSTVLRDSVIVLPADSNHSRKIGFNSFREVCPNQLINFYSNNVYESDSVIFIVNNIDTIIKPHFKYTFNSVGNYLVKQIVYDGNHNKFTYQDTIKVSSGSDFTNFSVYPRTFSDPLVGQPFQVFFEKGIYKIRSIDFGDNVINSNPGIFYFTDPLYHQYDSIYLFSHIYKKIGTYIIKVTYSDWCNNFDSFEYTYVVHDTDYQTNISTGLLWDEDKCYVNKSIDFYPYKGDYFILDFGDSTAQDTCFDEFIPVSHTYQNAGTYLIKCKAHRKYFPDEIIYRYIFISDDNKKPKVDFTVSKNKILINDTVSFIDKSYPGKTQWHWTFNGSSIDTSILQNPAGIQYTKAGIFDVTLKVKNSYGWTSLTKPDYITVIDSIPVANFKADSTVIFKNGTIDFTDLSTNLPTNWRWEFEGGQPSVSIIQNPINIAYNDTGTFAVKLFVSNPYGKDSIIEISYIKVLPIPKPIADFSSDIDTVFEANSVNFFDNSTNNPTFWKWEFEGGSPGSSLLQNPKNIFYNDTGSFKVKLFVSNQFGKDSLIKENFIQVVKLPLPKANFDSDTNIVFRNSTINFFDLSSNSPSHWKWEFEGGMPVNTTYQNPANIFYMDTGLFNVKLIVSNKYGADSILKTDYIKVIPYEKPTALFEADTTKILSGKKVSFTNKSTGYITHTKWYFEGGNPDSSVLNSPVVQYDIAGKYNVSLIVGNQDGFDTLTKTDYIHVDSSTSVHDYFGEVKVSIYPNPHKDFINLVIENCEKEIYLKLLNMEGKVVYEDVFESESVTISKRINTNHLAKGAFILRISSKDFIVNKQVIKF